MTKNESVTASILDREKIFNEWRILKKEIEDAEKIFEEAGNQLSRKRIKDVYYRRLIKVMIENDCDSVEAKLKYHDKLKVDDDDEEYDMADDNVPSTSTLF